VIKFICRDAKQFTRQETCQARSENKLDFHFKLAQRGAFSMSDIKKRNYLKIN